MLKLITFIYALCFIGLAQAQTILPVNVSKTNLTFTQKIIDKTTSITKLGDREINNSTNGLITNLVSVKANDINKATVQIKRTRFKTSTEMMGNKSEYDSDNPLTSNLQIAENLNSLVGHTTTFLIDAAGIITSIDTTQELALLKNLNISKYSGNSKGASCELFLIVNKPINIGDTWQDSTLIDNLKTVNHYKYKNVEKGIATIEQTSKVEINTEEEQMGVKMKIQQLGTSVGFKKVNIKTLLIVNRGFNSVLKGTMETSGQLIPMQINTEVNEAVE